MNFSTPFQMTSAGPQIDPDTKVVFVSDLFVEQYLGGAELTTDALFQSCEYKSQRIFARDVTMDLLEQGQRAFWIFGNFSSLNLQLIPSIVANMKYAVLEYDYKYCIYRSPEKHQFAEGLSCDCEEGDHGKMISAFYYGAKFLFWMSESQMNHYFGLFPFLSDPSRAPLSIVLSSVFDDNFFVTVKMLRDQFVNTERKGWIVLGSTSWVKGADQAEKWCKDNNKDYEVVWNLPYEELLTKLAQAEGFVYLPQGKDTCPRMVIEAKVLGCKLEINENVQNKDEEWFNTENIEEIEEYLYGARELFWQNIRNHIDYTPTISGYVTTRNCIEQGYPIKECIDSMQQFCDEIVVVDGGSTDGTFQMLFEMAVEALTDEEKESKGINDLIEDVRGYYGNINEFKESLGAIFKPQIIDGKPHTPIKINFEKFKLHLLPRDWESKRFAVFDGAQKAEARKLCEGEFCWQMDADEIVPTGDGEKVKNLCKSWPKLAELISLPVVEFWGSEDKVRVDVNPWKWRISKNLPHITHGIPLELRKFDQDGELHAAPGTDGCDYVHSETFSRIPHMSFYGEGAHNARFASLNGHEEALRAYEGWLQNSVDTLPSVKHYSWFDISRKIKTYRDFWQKHWESLYDMKQEDTPENNMFFDTKWSEVTDEDIVSLAKRLSEETGGHIFHTKWNGLKTPWVSIKI